MKKNTIKKKKLRKECNTKSEGRRAEASSALRGSLAARTVRYGHPFESLCFFRMPRRILKIRNFTFRILKCYIAEASCGQRPPPAAAAARRRPPPPPPPRHAARPCGSRAPCPRAPPEMRRVKSYSMKHMWGGWVMFSLRVSCCGTRSRPFRLNFTRFTRFLPEFRQIHEIISRSSPEIYRIFTSAPCTRAPPPPRQRRPQAPPAPRIRASSPQSLYVCFVKKKTSK